MGGQTSQERKGESKSLSPPPRAQNQRGPSPSKIKGSSKVNNTGDVETLKNSKTYNSMLRNVEQGINYDEYRLTRVPRFKKEAHLNRDEDYAQELNAVRQSRLTGQVSSLSYKIDDPDGVSEQAHVYTFDYDRHLNHYMNWNRDKFDGRSTIVARNSTQKAQ